MRLKTGFLLGPYKILSPLGAGGMGEVYRARDTRLGRDIAMKVLPEHLSLDDHALMRFEREAKATAALSHPNILLIFDVGKENGIHYAVTELLEGETLQTRLAAGALSCSQAAEIGAALAEGLAAAHSKMIVHRDLKPSNIFLTAEGQIKILDFGLARFSDLPSMEDAATFDQTETGTVIGTLGYMAPEQVRGLPSGAGTDIFSLGCVLYEMISGQRAFQAPSGAELSSAILRDTPSVAVLRARGAPTELERLVLHCLEKKPEQRFQSARDLAFALRAVIGNASVAKPSAAIPSNSIAVLPFENASHEPDTEYLSDGITESIINSLAQLAQLDVVLRSTVFRYKGNDMDPQTLGQRLNVRVVLTGRVIQRGESLIVGTELIDVAKGSQLWGERYNRKMSDIFALEEEIARKISESLRMKLTGDEDKRLAKRFTQSSEAYRLYLRGRRHWIRRTSDDVQKGAEYFQQAIEIDPGYALAYAGLADCYCVLAAYIMLPPKTAWAKAKAAAAAAVALDPELAESHASWGFIRAVADWDWRTAEEELRLAAKLNPAYWTAPYWLAMVLLISGRFEEADEQVCLAWDLEPLCPVIPFVATIVSIGARRYSEAVERGLKGIDIEPNHPLVRLYLGVALLLESRHAEAIAQMELAVSLMGDASTAMGQLAHAHAVSGNRADAQRLLKTLLVQAEHRPVDYYTVALAYVGLGEWESAFQWLEKARENRGVGSLALLVKGDPRMDILRPDPRFRQLMQDMALED